MTIIVRDAAFNVQMCIHEYMNNALSVIRQRAKLLHDLQEMEILRLSIKKRGT